MLRETSLLDQRQIKARTCSSRNTLNSSSDWGTESVYINLLILLACTFKTRRILVVSLNLRRLHRVVVVAIKGYRQTKVMMLLRSTWLITRSISLSITIRRIKTLPKTWLMRVKWHKAVTTANSQTNLDRLLRIHLAMLIELRLYLVSLIQIRIKELGTLRNRSSDSEVSNNSKSFRQIACSSSIRYSNNQRMPQHNHNWVKQFRNWSKPNKISPTMHQFRALFDESGNLPTRLGSYWKFSVQFILFY